MAGRIPVVSSQPMTLTRMRRDRDGGLYIGSTAYWRSTLACGHLVDYPARGPRPRKSSKCPEGCEPAPTVAR